MIQSSAPTVDAYLAQAPPEQAEKLRGIRERARSRLLDHDERMYWGMPAYLRDGRVSFGFAAQKQYVSLYFRLPAVLQRNADAVAGLSRGKACLRLRKSTGIDWPLIERLLEETQAEAAGR
jgi:uncharacterized protein YdhG (YjbR/CyaY superfamily)